MDNGWPKKKENRLVNHGMDSDWPKKENPLVEAVRHTKWRYMRYISIPRSEVLYSTRLTRAW